MMSRRFRCRCLAVLRLAVVLQLVCFSKVPLRNAQFTAFAATSERLNNKGFEQFDVLLDDRVVRCVNTHLDSRPKCKASQVKRARACARVDSHTQSRARAPKISQLGDALASLDASRALLLAGDFNVDSNDALASEFQVCAARVCESVCELNLFLWALSHARHSF